MRNFLQNPFKMFFPKKMVGIDIGASSIKVVELSRWGGGRTLENYGQVNSTLIYEESLVNEKIATHLFSADVASSVIKKMLTVSRIKTKEAIFSIPDLSTFFTSFEIPPMPEKEIPDAIRYNASQYITLPIGEVTLDWRIVPNAPGAANASMKVFLLAIPNQVIQEYQKIAKDAGLRLYALEAEALGITRALAKDAKKMVCLIDIGVQSSTINIIDQGFLKKSYSFNFYGEQLSRAISSVLGVSQDQAEEIKNKEGIISSRQGIAQTLYPFVDSLIMEIKNISAEIFLQEQKQVEAIYLTGGTAYLPGLREYISESLKKEVSIPNCFSNLLYPPILEETLKEMSPCFSVAVGVALGGLEAR